MSRYARGLCVCKFPSRGYVCQGLLGEFDVYDPLPEGSAVARRGGEQGV